MNLVFSWRSISALCFLELQGSQMEVFEKKKKPTLKKNLFV